MHIFVNEFSVTGHWDQEYDEPALRAWAESLRSSLRSPKVSLGLVFMSPQFFPRAAEVLELLQVHARVPLLAGCSSAGLILNHREVESGGGLVVGLYHLPGAELKAIRFQQRQVEAADSPDYWRELAGVKVEDCNGWLIFADPFHIDGETWLTQWNEAYPGCAVLGGLASGEAGEPRTQVYLNGEVFEDGGVAVAFGGAIGLHGVISQGCTPIGEPWTITRSQGNLIQEIGNRPAYQVLTETFNQLPEDQRRRAQGNLFVGLVVNEYQEEFHRGDFLIRNLLGGDPNSGVLAVGARPRPGQSLQFQCRDAEAASEDLAALLTRARDELGGRLVYGGCLCVCNGRGRRLFQRPDHDAALAQEFFGPLGVTGFFCNGELGPVGDRNYLHGYTASLALFSRK